jgi:uncharacterized cysteine cluster protein YcgN (CxxCxxCC family)
MDQQSSMAIVLHCQRYRGSVETPEECVELVASALTSRLWHPDGCRPVFGGATLSFSQHFLLCIFAGNSLGDFVCLQIL